MTVLAGGPPANYFDHPEAFPMLALPRWLEESIADRADEDLQADIAYATVCGYYFVRLLDDLMDGDRPPPSPVMPAMIVLHDEFHRVYQRLFPAEDPFWADFVRFSDLAAETASADASFQTVDRNRFLRVSARKTAGAKISVAALCHRHRRRTTLRKWSNFLDLLGRWHQMRNDVQGWLRDGERGAATYFRSEAARRSSGAEISLQWVAAEGFDWATDLLSAWMDEMVHQASGLGSPGLVRYLDERRAAVEVDWSRTRDALSTLASIAEGLDATATDALAADQPLRRQTSLARRRR